VKLYLYLAIILFSLKSGADAPGGVSAGLRLWLDASDTTTVFTDAACTPGNEVSTFGDTVRCWKGKGPFSFEATQAGAEAPTYVEDGVFPALEFTSDTLAIDGASGGAVFDTGTIVSETEVFFVARTRTITNGVGFRHNSAGRRYGSHFPWGNSQVFFDVGNCCGNARINAPWGGSSSFLHTWNFISDLSTPYQAIYRDGALVNDDATADSITWGTGDFYIGSNNGNRYQQMNAAEFIIYDRRLTDVERDQVKNYLLNKWRRPVEATDAWVNGNNRAITAPSGTDRLLVLAIGGEHALGPSISGVTYGGQVLTEIIQEDTGTSVGATAALFYLDDAGIEAAVGTNFVASYAGGTFAHTDFASAVYTNINQNNPVFTTVSVEDGQSFATNLSGSIPTTDGGVTLLTAQSGNNGTFGTSLTVQTAQSGNTTSQVVASDVETTAFERNFNVSHDNPVRMVVVAAHLRQNTLPEVSGLSALASSDTSITLNWEAVPGVTNYRISYSTGVAAPAICSAGILIDAGFTGTYQVTGLSPGVDYAFRVCASDGTDFTNGQTALETTDVIPPENANEILGVTLSNQQSQSVDFAIVSGGGGTTGFQIAYSPGSTPPADCNSGVVEDVGNTTSHTVNGLVPATTYSYRICAYNGTPTFTSGLTGSFNTSVVNSGSSFVNPIQGWATGAQRTDLGTGQNRALIVAVAREGGSDITGVSFGGQAMDFLAQETQGTLSVETYLLDEAGIQGLSGDTASATFSGGAPFYLSYSSIVFENVHQTLLASDVATNANAGVASIDASLNVNNGGYSIAASAHSDPGQTGSMGTPGWSLGFTNPVGTFAFATGSHLNTVSGTDTAQVDYNNNGGVVLNAAYLELAPPTNPMNLSLSSSSDTLANLEWNTGAGTTDTFRIAYQVNSAPADCSTGTIVDIPDVESYTLTGLTADQNYGLRLCSKNVQGILSAGVTLTFLTDDQPNAAPFEIVNLQNTVVSTTEIALNWQNGGGSTESFRIVYQAGATAPVDCNSGTLIDVSTSTAFGITGLSPNTQYAFRVCATNADGIHSAGLTTNATTQAGGSNSAVLAGSWQTGLTRTVDPGTNRALVFVVSSEDNVNADVTGVTYGGQALTFAQEAQSSLGALVNRVEIWYLLENEIQAAANTSFEVTWSDGNLENRLYAHAVIEDVHQTSTLFSSVQHGFGTGTNPATGSLPSLEGGISILANINQNDGTFSYNNDWSFGGNQTGTGSSLGTAQLTSSASGTEFPSANHTNPGISALVAVHFRAADPAPNEIQNLLVTSTSSTEISLGWDNAGGSTANFTLAYQAGALAPATCAEGISSTTINSSRTIVGLSQNTEYSFRVCSNNSSGESSLGLTVSGMTDQAPTIWTGTIDSNWFNAGNWSAGLPSSVIECQIPDVANDPVIDGSFQSLAQCKDLVLESPLNLDGSAVPVELEVYGNFSVIGSGVVSETNGTLSLAETASNQQTLSSVSALPNLNLKKIFGGSVVLNGDLTVGTLMTSGTNQVLQAGSSTLNIQNSSSIGTGTTLSLAQGAQVNIGANQTLSLSGGIIETNGSIDTSLQENPGYGPSQVNFGVIGGSGEWGFQALSGLLKLQGVRIDRLNGSGFRIEGSTSVTDYRGVHLTNLPVGVGNTGIYLDTTGAFPSSGAYNAFDYAGTPVSGQNTILAPGQCGASNHTYTFVEWFGNFSDNIGTGSVSDNAPVCDLVMETSASPVTMAEVQLKASSRWVQIDWETSVEFFHKGFNVYRKTGDEDGLTLMNSSLVKSTGLGVLIRGEYSFTDETAEPGEDYLYYLEDVPIVGRGTTYGPYRISTPLQPGDEITTRTYLSPTYSIEESDELEPTEPIETTSEVLASVGARWVEKADGGYRLFIRPPDLQTSESTRVPGMSALFMKNYHLTNVPGEPALPFVVLKLPVDFYFEGYQQTVMEKDNHTLALTPEPAANWMVNDKNRRLEPLWEANGDSYMSSTFIPQSDHLVISEKPFREGDTYFLSVEVYPTLFHGSSSSVTQLDNFVVDLDFNRTDDPILQTNQSLEKPLSENNGVRAVTTQSGFHRLRFEELFEQGLEAQFVGAQVNELQVTSKNQTIPFLFEDQFEEGFGPGDSLIFKSQINSTPYNKEGHFILSRVSENWSFFKGAQWSPAAPVASQTNFEVKRTYEVDSPSQFINDRPLGDLRDHYYWQRLFLESGDGSRPNFSEFCHTVNLSGLVHSQVDITIEGAMRSTFSLNQGNEARVYWSGNHSDGEVLSFLDRTHQKQKVSLTVPTAAEEALDLCMSVEGFTGVSSEYRIFDLDKIDVAYQSTLTPASRQFSSLLENTSYDIPIDESRGQFYILETTPAGEYYRFLPEKTGNGIYQITTSDHTETDSVFDIVYGNELQTFASLSQFSNPGNPVEDHYLSNLVIITSGEMMETLTSFISHKQSLGISSSRIDIQTIYDQYSYGEISPSAIRSFIADLVQESGSSVEYVLIALDGSVDTKNISGFDNANASPVYLAGSSYSDYASDLWFVTDDSGGLLDVAFGRIPARNSDELRFYLEKVMDYENGTSQPESDSISSIIAQDPFVDFQTMSNQLEQTVNRLNYSGTVFNSNQNTEDIKSHLTSRFKSDLFVNYMGHGTEFNLGDDHFNSNDIASLDNGDSLPIFVGLNCLTGYFEGADGALKSIGEQLVLQENAGSIMAISANTLLSPRDQLIFVDAFYERVQDAHLNRTKKDGRLGRLFLETHKYLDSQGLSTAQTKSFVLLGDPSLQLPDHFYTEEGLAGEPATTPEDDGASESEPSDFGVGIGSGCGRIGPPRNSSPWGGSLLILLFLFAITQIGSRRLRV